MNSRQRFLWRLSLFVSAGIKGFGAVYVVADAQTTPGQFTFAAVMGIGAAFDAIAASFVPKG